MTEVAEFVSRAGDRHTREYDFEQSIRADGIGSRLGGYAIYSASKVMAIIEEFDKTALFREQLHLDELAASDDDRAPFLAFGNKARDQLACDVRTGDSRAEIYLRAAIAQAHFRTDYITALVAWNGESLERLQQSPNEIKDMLEGTEVVRKVYLEMHGISPSSE